jgi:signal transduction histidine kinase
MMLRHVPVPTLVRWISTAALIALCWCGHAADPPAAPGPGQKVLRQYALTSANDFQQRDPQDWRLLASNDGGRNWVLLDRRTGEVFSRRHERRVFSIHNAQAFNLYRLAIDRVRNASGNSVQLAEIELLGDNAENPDLTPAFSDAITARGDNPPSESVARLFDRQVETKWLDRSPDRVNCSSWVQWEYRPGGGLSLTNISQLLELRGRAADGFRLRIEGVVAEPSADGSRLIVLDRTGVLEIDRGNMPSEGLVPARRILLEGMSTWRDGRVDVRDAKLSYRGGDFVSKPVRVAFEEPLESSEEFQWVTTVGVITFQRVLGDETFFELQQGDDELPVRVPTARWKQTPPATGSRVEVSGVCQTGYDDRGARMAVALRATEWNLIPNPPAVRDERDSIAKPTIRAADFSGINDIRQLTRKALESQPRVRIRGVITSVLGMYLQDGSGAIQVVFDAKNARTVGRLGTYVELEGWAGVSEAGAPLVFGEKILAVDRGKMPSPHRPSWGQLVSGQMDSQWIEMDGVVRATDGAHLLMNCDGRQVTASITAASADVVRQLVDAAVRVRGVGLSALDDWGRIQGAHLLIPSLEYVEVQQAAPKPFSQPIRPIGSILKLGQPDEFIHQVQVEGILTLQDERRLFLQDDTGSVMAIFKEDVVLDPNFGRSRWAFWRAATKTTLPAGMRFNPGDRVQVVGFRDTHGFSPVLTEVSVRKVGTGELEIQRPTTNTLYDWKLDAALVELDATLLARETLGSHMVLELLWGNRTLQALMPNEDQGAAEIVPGMRLRVTGIWQVDTVPYAQLGRRVASVRILPRSFSDIVILSRPSWWTVQHALAVIGGMAFVLLAASIWIRQLHRQVEQRSIQLTAEIGRRESIERQRALQEERARIAQDLHDDLGAALTQIRFLSAVESRDAQVPEGTREQLRKVSEKSHLLVTSLDEIVWAINPANDSLPNLANYLSHVAEEFFSTTAIRCRLDLDDRFPAVTLTSETRHNLYLAYREALNNIAKHSAATEVWVRFQWRDNALNIVIEDNGRGFLEAEAQPGEGLLNMRRRLEKIGGRFESESRPGAGTICRLWLPLR